MITSRLTWCEDVEISLATVAATRDSKYAIFSSFQNLCNYEGKEADEMQDSR